MPSITWISVENPELKLIFVVKFLKWLFNFFILLICKYFHVTYMKEERIFLFVKEWNKEKKNYLKVMNTKMALEYVKNACSDDADQRPVNRMSLVPKRKGLRSITRQKYVL